MRPEREEPLFREAPPAPGRATREPVGRSRVVVGAIRTRHARGRRALQKNLEAVFQECDFFHGLVDDSPDQEESRSQVAGVEGKGSGSTASCAMPPPELLASTRKEGAPRDARDWAVFL